MSDIKDEEVYLKDLGDSLKKKTNSAISSFSQLVSLIIKKWIFLVLAIVLGLGIGFFLNQIQEEEYEVAAVIRINNRGSDYVYNTLESLAGNLYNDSIMSSYSLPKGVLKNVEIEPISSFNDILLSYDERNEQMLRYLLENASAEEILSSEFFRSEYFYHKISIIGNSLEIEKALNRFVEILKADAYYQEINKEHQRNLEKTLQDNKELISQIDTTILRYNDLQKKYAESNLNSSGGVQISNSTLEVKELLATKRHILEEEKTINIELIQNKELIILMGKPLLVSLSQTDYMTIIPLLLVVLFIVSLGIWKGINSTDEQKN